MILHVPLLPIIDEHKEDELDYLVNWLQRYIDNAGLKKVILVGNSLGGHVAILYAHRNLQNVPALVLTGSSGQTYCQNKTAHIAYLGPK